MAKYRKIALIDAEPYKPGMEDGFVDRYMDKDDLTSTWSIRASEDEIQVAVPYIDTLEGDWIAVGVSGERWPIKDEIFRKTYERVLE